MRSIGGACQNCLAPVDDSRTLFCLDCESGSDHVCPSCPHQWQPIETAPHVGNVLITTAGTGWITVGFWSPVSKMWEMRQGYIPTHWMPLPELPEVTE